MALRMVFGVFAEYALIGEGNKLVVAGIFDTTHTRAVNGRFPLTPSRVVIRLTCSIVDGAAHSVSLRLRHEDGELAFTEAQIPNVEFRPSGPGRPMVAQIIARLDGLSVPVLGDYHLEVTIDQEPKPIGEIPLYVVEAQVPPGPVPGP